MPNFWIGDQICFWVMVFGTLLFFGGGDDDGDDDGGCDDVGGGDGDDDGGGGDGGRDAKFCVSTLGLTLALTLATGLLITTIPCTWLGIMIWAPNSTNGKWLGISYQQELAICPMADKSILSPTIFPKKWVLFFVQMVTK